jgi:hypothetical protein
MSENRERQVRSGRVLAWRMAIVISVLVVVGALGQRAWAAELEALAAKADALPPVEVKPAPKKLGQLELRPTLCELEGTPLLSERPVNDTAIGPIAMGPDGLLYLVGADRAIRRYRPDTSAGCKLVPDPSFGDGGKLVIEHKPTSPNLKAGALTADGQGRLFASAEQVYAHGAWRLSGGKVDYHCAEAKGFVAVNDAGTTGFAVTSSSGLQKLAFTDAGCTAEDFAPEEAGTQPRMAGVVDGQVLLYFSDTKQIHAYDLEGKLQGKMGTTEGGGPGSICSARFFAKSAGGHLVVDYNCKALRLFGDDGTSAEAVDLRSLLGTDGQPNPEGLTRVQDGTAYMTFTRERGEDV